jgi:hypothetical protein
MEIPMSRSEITGKRFGKLPEATTYSGISRASLYGLAAKHPGLFKKFGASTIVDFNELDAILDELPAAKIKPVYVKPAT